MSVPPDPTDAASPPALEWTVTHLRFVGTVVLTGAFAVAVWLVTRLVVGDFSASVETTFAVGSLAFRFGLPGWFGAVVLGRGTESIQAYLDIGAGWTEADARWAMARVPGFGLGVMLEATAVGPVAFVFVAA